MIILLMILFAAIVGGLLGWAQWYSDRGNQRAVSMGVFIGATAFFVVLIAELFIGLVIRILL